MVPMEILLLRADEVAKLLGLGRSKTYELMANGTLPVVRFGKSVRVPARALEEVIAAQSTTGLTGSEGSTDE